MIFGELGRGSPTLFAYCLRLMNACIKGASFSRTCTRKKPLRLIRLERSLLFGFTDLGEPVLGNDIHIKKTIYNGEPEIQIEAFEK